MINKPNYKLIYITGERFMFDFINSIQKNQTADFSKKYRVKSYKIMDNLMDNKKIDYSIEFIENA